MDGITVKIFYPSFCLGPSGAPAGTSCGFPHPTLRLINLQHAHCYLTFCRQEMKATLLTCQTVKTFCGLTVIQLFFVCSPQHLASRLLHWSRPCVVLKLNVHPCVFTQLLFDDESMPRKMDQRLQCQGCTWWSSQLNCHLKISRACLRTAHIY